MFSHWLNDYRVMSTKRDRKLNSATQTKPSSVCDFYSLTNFCLALEQVEKIPGGLRVQVFLGTSLILGLSAIPIWFKPQKAGHDLFSQEKPRAIEEQQEELKRQFRQARAQQAPGK